MMKTNNVKVSVSGSHLYLPHDLPAFASPSRVGETT